jgi:DNA repair protein RadA/Sms
MSAFTCALCGATSSHYVPTCPACEKPNALVRSAIRQTVDRPSRVQALRARTEPLQRTPTGLGTLDLALGEEADGSRGFVSGAAYILTGPEGAGKSTLALLVGDALATRGVLYVATEETQEKVEIRITRTRLGLGLPCLATEDIRETLRELTSREPALAIVDSLHGLRGNPEDSARKLLAWARIAKGSLLVLAHETKDGSVRGSKEIPYLFDATIRLTLETDLDERGNIAPPVLEGAPLRRFLSTRKNRFGPDGTWTLRLSARGWEETTPPPSPPADPANVFPLRSRRRR